MQGLNHVFLEGRLANKAQLEQTPHGNAYCHYTVMTHDRYRDKNGQWKEMTEAVHVQDWQINRVQYLTQGKQVTILGHVHSYSQEIPLGSGQLYTMQSVIVDRCIMGETSSRLEQPEDTDKNLEYVNGLIDDKEKAEKQVETLRMQLKDREMQLKEWEAEAQAQAQPKKAPAKKGRK